MSDADVIQINGYTLLECVATGNTSQVWEAKQDATNQTVAMKLLLPEYLGDNDAKKTLKAEAALGKKFDHPNLVKVYDLAVKKDFAYFAMEYLRAPSLKSLLRTDRPAAQGVLKEGVINTCAALEHMHEAGYLHRDIKPDNIILSRTGDTRVIDYSLAGAPDGALGKLLKPKSARTIQGTRTYIAPEVIRRLPSSFATDIYSLGITMYEVVTGSPPFRATTPNELLMMHVQTKPYAPKDDVPHLTQDASDLIMRMLSKKAEDRPQSMAELMAAVKAIEFWEEAPAAVAKRKAEAAAADDGSLEGVKQIDSRADAARGGRSAPPKPKTEEKPKFGQRKPVAKPEPPKAKPKPAAPQPTAPQPAAQAGPPPGYPPPGYPPQGYPQQPGYPPQPGYSQPPGYGQPQYGQPQSGAQTPSGQPPQGQPAAGPPQPGQPQPGPPQPGQPQPGQPQLPPIAGQPPQPSAPQPSAPQPSAPQPSAPQPSAPKAEEPKKSDDLELMTELPDVF